MKTLSCRNTCTREAPSKPLPPTRRAQESDSMTLLLVLNDEAEVGGDSQRLRYRARYCHLEARREGKGKGDQGLGFCAASVL
jgi:hypothetical protein